MDNAVNDLIALIKNANKPDVQSLTLKNVLAVTGTADGLQLIGHATELLILLLSLMDSQYESIKKQSSLILVNISAHKDGTSWLLNCDKNFIESVIGHILDENSEIADPCCMILSNITRSTFHLETIVASLKQLDDLLNIFTKNKYNSKLQNLYYLGPVLSNLSQSITVRRYILDRNKNIIQRLLPFTEFKESSIKRGGVIGTLRNCCFDVEHHGWLLSNEVDILPRLLLPLAGNEEYTEEENDKLPCDLQYLSEDKKREEEPDIRCMLLEAITLLCTLQVHREYIREQNTYIVVRELHKWEKNKKVLLACENLVDILIRTEEEIGKDNLKDLEIPDDLVKKFEKMDRDFLNN
ncbi:hypothetical protein FQA39_LY14842 [Lamprigera yunnana]|nr:hypothetical protein FQA39_LY14842 [Lamprigera yunnana]